MGDPVISQVHEAFLVVLALVRGDPSGIPTTERPRVDMFPQRPVVQKAAQAMSLYVGGHRDEAFAEYERLRRLLQHSTRGPQGLGTLHYLTELVEAFDDAEAAGWAHARWLPWAAAGGVPGSADYSGGGACARYIGRMAAVMGHLDDAVDALHAAAAINQRLDAAHGSPTPGSPWPTYCSVDADPGITPRQGYWPPAPRPRRQLDQPGPLARADVLLRQLAAERSRDDPLTPREREVATLVAQTLSNRAIADRLVLSERTVESHVHNILSKLGLANRIQLTAHLLSETNPLLNLTPDAHDRRGRRQ